MLDKRGNTVWSANDFLSGSGEITEFYCGSNVYEVQLRVNSKYSNKASGTARAWYK